jgi:outer membrane protein assembly factor BamB
MMSNQLKITARNLAIATILASASMTSAVQAEAIIGLTGDKTITPFDSSTLKAGKATTVKGVNGRIAGIDVRPSDGQLYAVTLDGSVYTINTATGTATFKIKLEKMLAANTVHTLDFNPAADRLRLIGSDGTSLRANVDDGKVTVDGSLKYAETDPAKGKTPNVVAGAYSNSVKGTKETALYDIDATLGTFLKQAPPNDGILSTLGKTGLTAKSIAFDIATDAAGKNTGYAMTGTRLYTIDIATGVASSLGKVKGLPGTPRDIAVIAR